jgi:cellobiose phosphorylase
VTRAPREAAVHKPSATLGYFDTAAREYVITSPTTPLPWLNYLGLNGFYSLISNTCGGYSFYRDAKLRRITRYRYDSVPLDATGKYLYIVDGGGAPWNPGWRPTRTALDSYECRHGLGYSRFRSSKEHLRAELTVLVADEHAAELQALTLTNESAATKTVRIVSYVEWCQWNADDDAANLQRTLSLGETHVEDGIVCHVTGYRERRRHYAYHTASVPIAGFESDRDAFLGAYGGLEAPAAVRSGRLSGSIASGWWPIASLAADVTLQPGQAETIVYATGFAEHAEEAQKWTAAGAPSIVQAKRVAQLLRDPDFVARTLDAQRARWEDVLGTLQASTPEQPFDDLANTWNPYQGLVNFHLSRSASLFETGRSRGIGFRDSNQDCLGVVHLVPDAVRTRLCDLAATQQESGAAYHQYQPLTKSGNDEIGGGFNDDPLWLVLAVSAYVRETGRLDLLDETVPFEDTPAVRSTMLDHVEASLRYTRTRLGPHGLPLIGRADWNDCLNLNAHSTDPDESFQRAPMRTDGRAESIMIGALFVLAARQAAALHDALGRPEAGDRHRASADEMARTVEAHGWDGEWYLRAYNHSGEPIGSRRNAEGAIYVEPQGLCSMALIGQRAGYPKRALDSTAERLACEYGIQLLAPPYGRYRKDLGEITTYLPGYKENGAVFCHNNPWVIIAETLLGNGGRAMRYLRAIAPTYQADPERRRTEPYVFAQMIAGASAARAGEGKNSWLTGSASWSYVAVTQYLLGIRPEIGGLTIDPCLPPEWDRVRVQRVFRGARYDIEIVNPRRISKGVRTIDVEGATADGTTIRPAPAGSAVRVRVELG